MYVCVCVCKSACKFISLCYECVSDVCAGSVWKISLFCWSWEKPSFCMCFEYTTNTHSLTHSLTKYTYYESRLLLPCFKCLFISLLKHLHFFCVFFFFFFFLNLHFPGLLFQSREVMNRTYILGLLHHLITPYQPETPSKWSDRLIVELLHVSSWTDPEGWNPTHFLDVGEMTHGRLL